MSEAFLQILKLERDWQLLEDVRGEIENLDELEKISLQIASVLQKGFPASMDLASSYLRMLARMLSRMMSHSKDVLIYGFKKAIVYLLERSIPFMEKYDPTDRNYSQLKSEDLKTILYSLALLLEKLKIQFCSTPSSQRAMDADSEHLLDVSLEFLERFLRKTKTLIINSDDINLQTSILASAIPQYVLICVHFSNVSVKLPLNISAVAMKAVKLLEAIVHTFDSQSFWQKVFPGLFSSYFNFIVKESSVNSILQRRSRDWCFSVLRLLLTLLISITSDLDLHNKKYLSNHSTSGLCEQISSASTFQSFLKHVRISETATVTGDTNLLKTTQGSICEEFRSSDELARWRVDFAQKIERSFPPIIRNLAPHLSVDQSLAISNLIDKLFERSAKFFGVNCVAELFVCFLVLRRDSRNMTLPFLEEKQYHLLRENLASKLSLSLERIIKAVPATSNLFPATSSSAYSKQTLLEDLRLFVALGSVLKDDLPLALLSLDKLVKVFPLLFGVDLQSAQRALHYDQHYWYFSFNTQRESTMETKSFCIVLDLPRTGFSWLIRHQLPHSHGAATEIDQEIERLLRTAAVLITRFSPIRSVGSLEERLRAVHRKLQALLKKIYAIDSQNQKPSSSNFADSKRSESPYASNHEISIIFDSLIAHLHFLQYAFFSMYRKVSRINFEESDKQMKAQSCDYCSIKKRELMRCSRCKSALYCCREHQQLHWDIHKGVCTPSIDSKSKAPLTTSSSCHAKFPEIADIADVDPANFFYPPSSTSPSSFVTLAVGEISTQDGAVMELITKDLTKCSRETLQNYLYLSSLCFTDTISNQRLKGFVLPLYSLLAVKVLDLLGDVCKIWVEAQQLFSFLLREILYVVLECTCVKDKSVSSAAKTCLMKIASYCYGPTDECISRNMRQNCVKQLLSDELFSVLIRESIDVILNEISSVFKESNLVLRMHYSSYLSDHSNSTKKIPFSSTQSMKPKGRQRNSSSHAFFLKYYPNHLKRISFNRAILSLAVIRLSFQAIARPQEQGSSRGMGCKTLLLLSKDLIEELLSSVDYQLHIIVAEPSMPSFVVTVIEVLREAVRFFPFLYRSTLPAKSFLQLSIADINSYSSFSADLRTFVGQFGNSRDRKRSGMAATRNVSRIIAHYLLFIQSIDNMARDSSQDEKRIAEDLLALREQRFIKRGDCNQVSEEEKDPNEREETLSEAILSLLVATRAKLTFFLSALSTSLADRSQYIRKECLEVATMVFLELLELQSDQQRLFEQEIFQFGLVLTSVLRDCHCLLRLRLATLSNSSHSIGRLSSGNFLPKLDLEERDVQRLSLLLLEQRDQTVSTAVSSTSAVESNVPQSEEFSFQLLPILSAVYDFFSILLSIRRSGESVADFLSLRLSEDLLPEISRTLLLFLRVSVSKNSRSSNPFSLEDNAQAFSRDQQAKVSLLRFISHCMDNEDFIKLFSMDESTNGFRGNCDVFKTWIYYFPILLLAKEGKTVKELGLSILKRVSFFEPAFFTVFADIVISAADKTDRNFDVFEWKLLSRDRSLFHNCDSSGEKDSRWMPSEEEIDRLLNIYCEDDEVVKSLKTIKLSTTNEDAVEHERKTEIQHLEHFTHIR